MRCSRPSRQPRGLPKGRSDRWGLPDGGCGGSQCPLGRCRTGVAGLALPDGACPAARQAVSSGTAVVCRTRICPYSPTKNPRRSVIIWERRGFFVPCFLYHVSCSVLFCSVLFCTVFLSEKRPFRSAKACCTVKNSNLPLPIRTKMDKVRLWPGFPGF